jgi:putative SOS response-associated peptidase YedK
MCGRFSITTPIEEVRRRFKVDIADGLYQPRYNVAPGQEMPVIPEENPHQAEYFRWGLIPHWAKDAKIGNRLINARAETVAEKPSFRTPFKKHRCLVLADGFYEWDKKSPKHIPYRIILKNQEPFAFAGLCDYWKDEKGKEIKSFTIITTQANSMVSKIHNRMPVILSRDAEAKWLDSEAGAGELKSFLKPYPSEKMEAYQISTLVNNPRNNTEEVLMRNV